MSEGVGKMTMHLWYLLPLTAYLIREQAGRKQCRCVLTKLRTGGLWNWLRVPFQEVAQESQRIQGNIENKPQWREGIEMAARMGEMEDKK